MIMCSCLIANRLRDMSQIALMLSFISVGLLGCGGGGGGGSGSPTGNVDGTGNGDNMMMANNNGGDMMTADPVMQTFTTGTPSLADRTGGTGNDVFTIEHDITGDAPALTLGVLDGAGGSDRVELDMGADVGSIFFSAEPPSPGDVHLQNIETITISGGRVNGDIDARAASAGVTFNLESGAVFGGVFGGDGNDRFFIGSSFDVFAIIDGGGGTNTLSLSEGFTPVSANLLNNVLTLLGNSILRIFTLENIDVDIPGLTTFTGTEERDIFTIANDITNGSPGRTLDRVINGGGGALDELRLDLGAVVGNIRFSTENPTGGDVHVQNIRRITISDGTVNGVIDASSATRSTTITLQASTTSVTGDITGSSHNDTFTLRGGTVGGSVLGGAGGDVFDLSSAIVINGVLDGEAGNDRFTLNGGMVMGNVNGGANNDTFNLSGSMVMGNVNGGAGDDTFNLNSGTIGNVNGGDGDDRFTLNGDIDIIGNTPALTLGVIDGAAGSNEVRFGVGAAVDSITFSDPPLAGTGGVLHLKNIETITIDGGIVRGNNGINVSAAPAGVTFHLNRGRIGAVTGSNHADTFGLNGSEVAMVLGGAGDDRFVISSGHMTDNITIDGQGGNDIVSLAPGFTPSASLSGNVLTLDGTLRFNLQNIDDVDIMGFPLTLAAATPGDDVFVIAHNLIVGERPARTLNIVIGDDGGGDDRFRLDVGGTVNDIFHSGSAPEADSGDVHLQNVFTIEINGGTVTGIITGSNESDTFDLRSGTVTGNVEGRNRADTFNLRGGMIEGSVLGGNGDDTFDLRDGTVGRSVLGGEGNDTFNLYDAIVINGVLDGGNGTDTLQYAGAPAVENPEVLTFLESGQIFGGLNHDPNIGDTSGSVQNIERQRELAEESTSSLSVRNIEALALSPALNLYGALSDALMQFGQQTAEGFALADLNPQTGRLTQLMSKASPFTKGHIWAHKITHSGNGKGSIGLNLTGLTARASNDYDYQMSLTQHGFDAPVVSSQWGDFGLRAVSHTMTGTIETNIAEAQVSGYGAGVSLLGRSLPRHNLSAHITALAGAYEVDAYTSPSNPQAVVNEVSEGSFSAINAVISAGVADKRELAYGLVIRTTADVTWQTLSLDDFTETGADGIIINFDKATRLTARIGAGLEGEHWFSDLAFVHETSSGGTLSSGLRQDYRQHDGTAIEMKLGGKMADLTPGLTIKAFAAWRQSVSGLAGEPSAQFEFSYRF